MITFEIDRKGFVIRLSGLPLEKGNSKIEMSVDQTLAMMPEKCDKGFATRIVTMDGAARLVGKTPHALIAEMKARHFWPTLWEMSAYYALYAIQHKRLNKAEIGPGVAFYPVTDSQRNTTWINVAAITGVTCTARGAIIETSAGVNFYVTKTADSVRADLAAIKVISRWMLQAYTANQFVNKPNLLGWLPWPYATPYDVNVQKLEMIKVLLMLGHLSGVVYFGTKLQTALEEVAMSLKEHDCSKFGFLKVKWLENLLRLK